MKRNAIIMAAGMSSRFAPLSYELPKALLNVKGEVLVERQIRQLKQAGIEDITIVVGYKKELFYYLKDKYQLEIVENDKWYCYNNISTLMCVLDKINDTYICSADNYFVENVFMEYPEHSYYAAVYAQGKTKEWCLNYDKNGIIREVIIGGEDAWYMLGHVFFKSDFSEKFKVILKNAYIDIENRKKLWEYVYKEHIDELELFIQKYQRGLIWEFDTLEELREFDTKYQFESNSSAMHIIKKVLKCEEKEILEIEPIDGGLTNKNFCFVCRGERYVYRYPGEGTELIINRKNEKISTELAADLEIDTELIYFDEETGVKITKYIEDAETMTKELLQKEENLYAVAKLLYKLHTSGKDTKVEFDVFKMAERYETYIYENKVELFENYEEMKRIVLDLKKESMNSQEKIVPCHNDPLCANWVKGKTKMYLIDWEYAGMNDAMWDLADVAIEAELTKCQESFLLQAYFDRKPINEEIRCFEINKIFIDYLWSLWGKTRVPFDGDEMEQYALNRYERMKSNLIEMTL